MIRLPLFERLRVRDYGMFPGSPAIPGFDATFQPGLTLVLGANGLGKTTLVTLLYRMCTGPYDIPGIGASRSLGTVRLASVRLGAWDRRTFADRVADRAASATATLNFRLGTTTVEVTRELQNLNVTELAVAGTSIQATDDRFQDVIRDIADVPTFGDWILLLRYLVFYFEDRRALVWDASAQRQLLRLLLLPANASKRWAAREREVLELDSRVRNLQSTLNREERVERRTRTQVARGEATIVELAQLDNSLAELSEELDEANQSLPPSEQARQQARLQALTLEQSHDSARRNLEELQLEHIASAFPTADETALYLMSRLLSTEVCQTCGNAVPDLAKALESRLESDQCIVCGSSLRAGANAPVNVRRLRRLTSDVKRLTTAVAAAKQQQQQAEHEYDELVASISRLDLEVAKKRAAVASLVRQLPPDEQTLRRQTDEVSALRGRLERLRNELDEKRETFESLVQNDSKTMLRFRDEIVARFEELAREFLFEASNLRWAPNKARVGQTGPLIEFPAFEFEMAGSDFPTPVRRSDPDDVSESQREFIDLAFRMTLMRVATETGSGSLVIDAPEASLDAVFSERAADVLVRFGEPSLGNRLLITSNLVDSQLIPRLLAGSGIESPQDPRLIDLLAVATPTRAVIELGSEYAAARDRLFSSQGRNRR